MSLSSFAELAAKLMTAEADMKLAQEVILEKACRLVESEAKRVIGTYDYGWKQLAESTQEERVKQGFSANEPLLRTGELRRSIEHKVDANVGYVGTNDPVAKYHEFGTSKIPPRPFLAGAAEAMGPKIQKMAERTVADALSHGGPNFHAWKEAIHLVKEAYHAGKEVVDEILDDEDKR